MTSKKENEMRNIKHQYLKIPLQKLN